MQLTIEVWKILEIWSHVERLINIENFPLVRGDKYASS